MLGMGGLTGGFLSGWVVNAIGPRRSMLLCFSACAALSFLLFKTNSTFRQLFMLKSLSCLYSLGSAREYWSVYIPGFISRS